MASTPASAQPLSLRLAADPTDRATRERVAADMDAVAADWPE